APYRPGRGRQHQPAHRAVVRRPVLGVGHGAPPPPPKAQTEEEKGREATKKAEQIKREGTDAERVLVRGESGSRGVVTGRVRIVAPETPVPDVAEGDVLVA